MKQVIYTGNFANEKKYVANGFTCISIALKPSRFFVSRNFMPELAPTYDMLSISDEAYVPKYAEILKKINPEEILNKISILSKGKPAVLMCFEKEGDFCHRRLVAEWLQNLYKIEVKELGRMEQVKNPKKADATQGSYESFHYDFEITKERNIIKVTSN